ncbi:hypothetical protein KC218_23975, partial [Mycobacterium tuberculosis]|nr:hypothetical protein [Mycobacterium tuberculosis]
FIEEEQRNDSYPAAHDSVEQEISLFLLHRHHQLEELEDFFRTFIPLSLRAGPVRESVGPTLLRETTLLKQRLTVLQSRHFIRAALDLE